MRFVSLMVDVSAGVRISKPQRERIIMTRSRVSYRTGSFPKRDIISSGLNKKGRFSWQKHFDSSSGAARSTPCP